MSDVNVKRSSRKKDNAKNYKRRAAMNKIKRRCLFFAFLGVLVACFFFFAPIFAIDNIVCDGNEKVSSEDIVSKSALVTGRNLFSARAKQIGRAHV